MSSWIVPMGVEGNEASTSALSGSSRFLSAYEYIQNYSLRISEVRN